MVTLLIIGTLAFDAWDFVRQVTEAEPGLGWQIVLVVLGAFGIAAGVGWLVAQSSGGGTRRLGLGLKVLAFVGVVAVGLTIVGGWRMLNRLGTEITQVGWFLGAACSTPSTIIVGTFMIVLIAMAVAVPLGLGAAVYLSEYASRRVRRMVSSGPRRDPQRRAGVLRHLLHQPEHRRALLQPVGQGVHDVGGWDRRRRAHHPDHRLGRRGHAQRRADVALGFSGLDSQRSQTTLCRVPPPASRGSSPPWSSGSPRKSSETMVVAIAAGAMGGACSTLRPALTPVKR